MYEDLLLHCQIYYNAWRFTPPLSVFCLNDFQITDRKLTLDDDFDDPELAKALELSLKEASDRAQV